jgi:hypothetical protein
MRPTFSTTFQMLAAVAALAIATFASSVQAQRVPPQPIQMSPELKAFMSRAEEQKIYNPVLAREWRYAVDDCPSPTLRGLNVVITVSPTFDAGGAPVSGEWRLVGQFEGCGKSRFVSVVYGFGPDGKMVRAALLPGTTAADPRLQLDSVTYAALGMSKLAPKDCKDTRISDTKFVAFEGGTAPAAGTPNKRAWTEEWTVRSCGVTGLVTMHFRPDTKGTQISANLNETRKLDP